MIAAIYARKSTEQKDADAEAKSVARQIENARAFAKSRGWTVHTAHVYSDDAVSGAETRKLVNRQRLFAAAFAEARPPFDVLILRDSSRFSREDGDTAFAELKRLALAGVRIWFYSTGRMFTHGTFGDNVAGYVDVEMNAEYRRKIARDVTEAMRRKALKGHVTGGRVFGYDNVRIDGHVERRINDAQAAVVRRAFEMRAAGDGFIRIAKTLNAERVPAPRPHAKISAWHPITIKELLRRETYIGRIVWNTTKKRDPEGKLAFTKRPASEWVRLDQPALRIISDELWGRAHAVDRAYRERYFALPCGKRWVGYVKGQQRGQNVGHPRDFESKYLLSGFARCGTCGGRMGVVGRERGARKNRVLFYGCAVHAKRGTAVCANSLIQPLDVLDAAVTQSLMVDGLGKGVVRRLITRVFELLQPTTVASNVRALQTELAALNKKIARLAAAVEGGAAIAPLIEQLHARNAERETLLAAIAHAEAMRSVQADRTRIERTILAEVEGWIGGIGSADRNDQRAALRSALEGPITLTPKGDRYHFSGRTSTLQRIAGLAGVDAPSTEQSIPNGNIRTVDGAFSGIAA